MRSPEWTPLFPFFNYEGTVPCWHRLWRFTQKRAAPEGGRPWRTLCPSALEVFLGVMDALLLHLPCPFQRAHNSHGLISAEISNTEPKDSVWCKPVQSMIHNVTISLTYNLTDENTTQVKVCATNYFALLCCSCDLLPANTSRVALGSARFSCKLSFQYMWDSSKVLTVLLHIHTPCLFP